MSILAHRVGASAWSGGDRIIPFADRNAAFAWAQEHLSHRPDVLAAEFGDLIA
jgi:hypothetical protein